MPLSSQTDNSTMAEEVSLAIRYFHAKGWCPATSSNFSFRPDKNQNRFFISVSGLDKGGFSADDFMPVDISGQPLLSDSSLKPSAETLLHALVYELDPEAGVVLHMHSPNAVVYSKLLEKQAYTEFSDYEILKGFSGVSSHQESVRLYLYPNSQDMGALSRRIAYDWQETPLRYGFLLKGHGLYAWGKTVAEAKRHVEVFEYLFECERKLMVARQ